MSGIGCRVLGIGCRQESAIVPIQPFYHVQLKRPYRAVDSPLYEVFSHFDRVLAGAARMTTIAMSVRMSFGASFAAIVLAVLFDRIRKRHDAKTRFAGALHLSYGCHDGSLLKLMAES